MDGNNFIFYVVTDPHFMAADEQKDENGRRRALMREAVLDSAFARIAADGEAGTVIVSGDLANNGERKAHLCFIEKLRGLQKAGKQVFVITATHDYGLVHVCPDGTTPDTPADCVPREELRSLYEDFGFSSALSECGGLSYCVSPAPGYRLLCLNDDGDGRAYCGYSDETREWIRLQILEAKKAGDYIFATTHHPMLAPSPIYPIISERDMLGAHDRTVNSFANDGIHIVFTGHTHMQAIHTVKTDLGALFTDVGTGALTEYPAAFRRVVMDGRTAHITSLHPQILDIDTDGKEPMKYLSDDFDSLINRFIDAAADDIGEFTKMAVGEGADAGLMAVAAPFIHLAGKALRKMTLGGLAAKLHCGAQVAPEVAQLRVRDVLCELLRNIWRGDEPYSDQTPVGRAVLAIVGRCARPAAIFMKKTPAEIIGFIAGIIYDPTPDGDADIPMC